MTSSKELGRLIIIFRDVLEHLKEFGPDPLTASEFQIRRAVMLRLHRTPVLSDVQFLLSNYEDIYKDWLQLWKNYQLTGIIPDYPDNF